MNAFAIQDQDVCRDAKARRMALQALNGALALCGAYLESSPKGFRTIGQFAFMVVTGPQCDPEAISEALGAFHFCRLEGVSVAPIRREPIPQVKFQPVWRN